LRKRFFAAFFAAAAAVAVSALAACSSSGPPVETPGLAARGTVMTTAKPTRQDLANRLSLTGKVTINPIFGLVAPVTGQIRYVTVSTPQSTPTKPTKVATVWAKGKAHVVNVPAGAIFTGRLVDDRSTVQAGMPIVSAKYVGYGLVADIDGAQAYKISAALSAVRGQISNGPGPFDCTVLGTIAALPAGVIPEPPQTQPDPNASPNTQPSGPPAVKQPEQNTTPSDPTGMRVVCIAPAKVKLINGASATLEVVTERATNALVLPVEAVAGGQGKGMVDVVRADGTRETREVVLGLTDGKVIEIKSGLTEADTVALPGPDLPQAPPNIGPDGSVQK
jgi:hypothetical protein